MKVICSEERLIWLWKHEMVRVIADRFILLTDGQWFDKYIGILSAEVLSPEQVEYLSEEAYFVDFMRCVPVFFCDHVRTQVSTRHFCLAEYLVCFR